MLYKIKGYFANSKGLLNFFINMLIILLLILSFRNKFDKNEK